MNLELLNECKMCNRREEDCEVISPEKNGLNTKYMFVFAKPSQEENLMLQPVAGIKRHFLQKILKEIGIFEETYFTLALKCGIKNNISKKALHSCDHWLSMEIYELKPKVVFSEIELKHTHVSIPTIFSALQNNKKCEELKKIIKDNL